MITVGDLQEKFKAVFNKRKSVAIKKEAYKQEQDELDKLEFELLVIMEENKIENFETEDGRFYLSHRTSIKVPQGEDREIFFNYLKEQQIFDELITVNSQTLNAWYKETQAQSENPNRPPLIPGLGLPSISQTLNFRKS